MASSDRFEDRLFSRAQIEDRSSVHLPHHKPRRVVHFDESTKLPPTPQFADSILGRKPKPGSKRYKRFMKNVELLETALSDSEGEEFEIEVEYTVEFRSPFTVIFEDEEFRSKWEPFIDITEEEEANLLEIISKKHTKAKKQRDPNSPSDCWKNLGKYAKKTLKTHADSPMIAALDQMLIDFILSRGNRKSFVLTSQFQRLLCHSIASFYSMQAHTTRNGPNTFTTITKSKTTQLPSLPLSEFLKTKIEAL